MSDRKFNQSYYVEYNFYMYSITTFTVISSYTCYLLCMLPPLSGEPLHQRIFIHYRSVVYISYEFFITLCHLHLRNRLLDQGYKKIRLIRSLKKFIFRYQYLVEIYSVSAEKIISDVFSYSENV